MGHFPKPEVRISHAKIVRGNPIFGSVEPCDLLETRSSLHYASKSVGFCSSSKLSTQLGRTTSWSPKSQCVHGPENEIAAVTFFAKNGAALLKSNTFANVSEWQDSREHGS